MIMELKENLPQEVLALPEQEQEAYLMQLLARFRQQEKEEKKIKKLKQREEERGGAEFRFPIGSRVYCNTAQGWKPGTISAHHYKQDGIGVVPYQIELDGGGLVFAPYDDDEIVQDATSFETKKKKDDPWHVAAGKSMRQADIQVEYPKIANQKELFNPDNVDEWFVPELKAALKGWQETGDLNQIRVDDIPGLRIEAPGVISFDCLTPETCDKLLLETKSYLESGMPTRAPNSMNNYGVVLNEIGLRGSFDTMLQRIIHGLGAKFFGDSETRVKSIGGVLTDGDDWGGNTLSDHHTFVVQYRPDQDQHLDMHVDECDVTFNFGLTDPDGFTGSELAFCGMFGSGKHRKLSHNYTHVKGRCVCHSGKRRHGALNIKEGKRASLIMWTKSPQFRQTEEYMKKWGNYMHQEKEVGDPDRICLSYTHDRDFMRWSKILGNDEGVMPSRS